jgi:poly-D-alanine transfer protein DltD
MYTTIIIIQADDLVRSVLDPYVREEFGAEIDQEFKDIVQYTAITKHEPDFSDFEFTVNLFKDSEPNVQYVTIDLESAYISETRRYCGCWYND